MTAVPLKLCEVINYIFSTDCFHFPELIIQVHMKEKSNSQQRELSFESFSL